MNAKKGFKKRILQAFVLFGFFTILFSCQGSSLNKIVHTDISNFDHQELNCCEKGGGLYITPAHIDSLFVFPAPNFSLSTSITLVFFAIFLSFFSGYLSERGKEYVRSIINRCGSFTPLNSFVYLFSQGLLHSKVF